MKLNKSAKKLLERVIKAMEVHPLNVDMDVFIDHDADIPSCGTAGCIASWVIAKASLRRLKALGITHQAEIPLTASMLLGLNKTQTASLFYTDYWPAKFLKKFNGVHRLKFIQRFKGKYRDRAIAIYLTNLVIKRIKDFIKTGPLEEI